MLRGIIQEGNGFVKMQSIKLYYLLNSECIHNCRECYLDTQKRKPPRRFDTVMKDLEILTTHNIFDYAQYKDPSEYETRVRITGSNTFKFPGIEKIVSLLGQEYLLGDVFSIYDDLEVLEKLAESGLKRVFLTSAQSINLRNKTLNTKEIVDKVKENGLDPILSYIIGAQNYEKADEYINEALSLGLKSMRFVRLIPHTEDGSTYFLSDELLSNLLEKVYSLRAQIPKEVLRIYIHGHFGTEFRMHKGKVCFAGEQHFSFSHFFAKESLCPTPLQSIALENHRTPSIISVLKIISRHLSRFMKIVLKGNTAFSGPMLGMSFTAILTVVSCTTDLQE